MKLVRPSTTGPHSGSAYGARDGEWEVVELMVALREDGYAMRRIAMTLNERGIPTRFGRLWHQSTVTAIMERYAPHLVSAVHTKRQRDEPAPVEQGWAPKHQRDQQRQRAHRGAAASG